jgi:outer membrane lipoprotein SlyB
MKNALSVVTGVLLAASSFAGLSQLTLSISTPGPDTYADGQPVQVGETYLLVYVNQGASFQGLYTDGSLVDPVNNRVATKAYAVAGAKCGFKAVQYPAELFPAGGSWVIVVLDTRTGDGALGGLVAGQGVSAATVAAGSTSTSLGAVGAASQGVAGLTVSGQTLAPAGTPAPEITAVQPNGDTVNVRFKNFSDKALYEVQSTTDLAGQWQTVAKRVQATAQNIVQGENGAELPAAVQVPAGDKVRFFKVIVPNAAQ